MVVVTFRVLLTARLLLNHGISFNTLPQSLEKQTKKPNNMMQMQK